MFKQIHWRIAGGLALFASIVMILIGMGTESLKESPQTFLIYWGLVFFLLVFAIYCALVDFRFIRVQYTVEQRDLFHATLGAEEFRRQIREGNDAASVEQEDTE